MKKQFLSIIFFLTAFATIAQIRIADRQKMSYNPTTHILTLENSDPVDLSGLVGGSSEVTDLSLSGNILSITLDSGTPVTVDLSAISGSVSDGSVTTAKLADAAVTSTKILNGTILNADINDAAGIDATKIADGSVTNTELQYINSVTSNVQTQIDANTTNITTNSADIDDIETALATVPASAIDFNNQTVDYTLVAADANDNRVVMLAYDNEDLTVPSGVFSSGQSVVVHYDSAGTGNANIIQGLGVDILGYTDGITLSSYPSGFTLVRTSTATAPEVYQVFKPYGTLTDYVASSLGAEKVLNGTFSDTSSWTLTNGSTISGGILTVIAKGTISSTGSNHIVHQAVFASDLDVTKNYRITFDARQIVGSGNLQLGVGFGVIFNQAVTGSMTTYTFDATLTPSGTGQSSRFSFGGAINTDQFEIDNISIKEIL